MKSVFLAATALGALASPHVAQAVEAAPVVDEVIVTGRAGVEAQRKLIKNPPANSI